MKQKFIFLLLACLPVYLLGQANNGKDLVFKVKAPKTRALITPDVAWIYCEGTQPVTIRIRPSGRKLGKVTFLGGEIEPNGDGSFKLTAGTGTEGILHVYENTPAGDKLIIRKVYEFKKIIIPKFRNQPGDPHICSPGDGHHKTGIRAGNRNARNKQSK